MANSEHLTILKEGVEVWNQWREENPTVKPDFWTAELRDAQLERANLSGADLSLADLDQANLYMADLIEANLQGATLRRANLREANLRMANLQETHLRQANLSGASLEQADFRGASVAYTTFAEVNLNGVNGLDYVVHRGPSSIGIDTIYKSNGNISQTFLRGAGVPDVFITYMKALNFTGIEFYSLFISYSTQDQEFAERIHADLQSRGVRCWFAPLQLRGGDWLDGQLEGAIRAYDKLLLIISETSMASDWVKWEISNALTREEKEGKRVLFPIRLCSYEKLDEWKCSGRYPGSDLAPAIRRYFIPDFSNWKNHDSYKRQLNNVIDALQGKSAASSV
jgi:uncharacterized protein YjbI with pentapeptide repeats